MYVASSIDLDIPGVVPEESNVCMIHWFYFSVVYRPDQSGACATAEANAPVRFDFDSATISPIHSSGGQVWHLFTN